MAIFLGNIKGLDVAGSQYSYLVFDGTTGSAPQLYVSNQNYHSTAEVGSNADLLGRFLIDGVDYVQQINALSFQFIGSGGNIQVTNTGDNAWTFNGFMAINGINQLTTTNLEFTTGTGTNLTIGTATASDLTVTNLTVSNGTWTDNGLQIGNSHLATDHISATYFNATSDRNAKKEFKVLPSVLSLINNTSVYSFKYKESNTPSIGIIAQDVQDINFDNFNLTEKSANGMLSIHESKLVYILWKGIQEQQIQIEELKAEIAALKGGN